VKAFWVLLRHELRLLHRQKVLIVSAVAVLLYLLAVQLLPPALHPLWLPAILISEVVSIGVLFIAGTLFVEIRQQTTSAFAVSPVATHHWIGAKLAAFTLLAMLAAQALLLGASGFRNSLPVSAALLLSALLYNQFGFIIALWAQSVRSFFLPLSVVMGLLGVSIYAHFGFSDSPLFWLIPSYPALLLLASADSSASTVTLLAALFALLLWNLGAFVLCRRLYHARIARRVGG
jgi:fluoroquinolone transport system permease protein